ncbi:MAG TPA: chemotaxis response regulator protein-glutamate methylesterase [Deltaproteobacteria bacterium]|nr:chemotaxis response regulator protein-glutamate methylesterase [Deltaproteobacteria bacterium]
MRKIRVLTVDDSAFMRRVIRQMLESDPEIEVVGAARDGMEGVEMALDLKPDVITMDIEMPRMNGLDATSAIMEKSPRPIIMLSSLTSEGAKATFDALDRGAVDYISKNLVSSALDIMKVKDDLVAKIKAVSKVSPSIIRPRPAAEKRPARGVSSFEAAGRQAVHRRFVSQKIAMVAIGASTGGPRAIQEIIPRIPVDIHSAFLVAVHMPKAFTGAFAERLNGLGELTVKEAEDGEAIRSGHVYISPGGRQTRAVKKGAIDMRIVVNDEPESAIYRPSVDVMMTSVAETYPGRSLGVILTGMGHDGLEGMRAIKEKGGKTLVQDEKSCTVFGMPKAVIEADLADKTAELGKIAAEIVNML